MKPVQIYLRVILAILSAIAIWGVLAPICVSSEIDILVIFGILLVPFEPLLIYWLIKPIYKSIKNKKENENKA
jgi:hypothetical protein